MQNRELKEFLGRFPETFKITVNGTDFGIKGDFSLDGAELGGVINLVSADAAAAKEDIGIKTSSPGKKMPSKFKNLRDGMLSDIMTGMPRQDFMKKYGASYNTFIRYRAKACGYRNKTAADEKEKHNAKKERIDGHKSEVKRNRENIKNDILAGMPKEKVIEKYGIGIATYNRSRREAESGTKGIPANNSSEAGPSGHAGANGSDLVKRIFTEEERKSIAKEFLSLADRSEKDVIGIAGKYGIKYKTVYYWAKKYADALNMPYVRNSGGQGFKKRMREQTERKEKIIAAVNAGKSREEAESEIGSISKRSWYRYVREAKIAKGEAVTESNRRPVRLNRDKIMADIKSGMPDKEIINKWRISRTTLKRHKFRVYGKSSGNDEGRITPCAAVPEIFGDGSIEKIEKAMKDHAGLKSFSAETGTGKGGSSAGRHMRSVIKNRERIISELVNGMPKKECMFKWKISERLYNDLKSIAVARSAEEPERTAPLLTVSKARLERSRSIIEELNRAEDRVYKETGDYNFMLVKKNSNQTSSRNP